MPSPTDPERYEKSFFLLASLFEQSDETRSLTFADTKQALRFQHRWYSFVRAHEKTIEKLERRISSIKNATPDAELIQRNLRLRINEMEVRFAAIKRVTVIHDEDKLTFISRDNDARFHSIHEQLLAQAAATNIDIDAPPSLEALMPSSDDETPSIRRQQLGEANKAVSNFMSTQPSQPDDTTQEKPLPPGPLDDLATPTDDHQPDD